MWRSPAGCDESEGHILMARKLLGTCFLSKFYMTFLAEPVDIKFKMNPILNQHLCPNLVWGWITHILVKRKILWNQTTSADICCGVCSYVIKVPWELRHRPPASSIAFGRGTIKMFGVPVSLYTLARAEVCSLCCSLITEAIALSSQMENCPQVYLLDLSF